ncbi:hypothetical protein [Halomonas salifodinae]|uniref:hypothetical protein n=1 Tax=Halomonas salifodinae TaxID=438745 RepID=UPI0033AF3217
MRFVVIYGAYVLYPPPLQDLLMRLATSGLFAARWTEQIRDEWTRNLLQRWPELVEALPCKVELMSRAVPDCLATGHESLIEALQLTAPDDRHILVAAIPVRRATVRAIVLPALLLGSYADDEQ